ncbi:MAG: hypothetical protein IPM61_07990 [Chlorobi bacterium]|nr:MAG: hypothetical protein UZ07_CHB004001384 [Chlorobi bacterium OLB7]MBK8911259.1 hypothetical protein [Chlorobiota bacterium]
MKTQLRLLAALIAATLIACGNAEDETLKQQLVQQGFSQEKAAQLSSMQLTDQEIQELGQAKRAGLDEAAAIEMVKSMHERNLKFDLGSTVEAMSPLGLSPTAMTQLTEMGALPNWADDIRAMKGAGIGEEAILELSKMKFKENKTLLSGLEYSTLKPVQMSDASILTFARKGGSYQQLQEVRLQRQLGKSEVEALKSVGM